MAVRPGQILLYATLAVVGLGVLAAAVDAAGHDVAVGVAVAALAALAGSYLWVGVTTVRLARRHMRDETEEVPRPRLLRRMKVHGAIMACAPLVVAAAHPWGVKSVILAAVVMVVGQFLLLHGLIVTGAVLRRRARTTRPR